MSFFACSFAVALMLTVLVSTPTGSAQTSGSWKVVPSPNKGSLHNTLAAVAPVSADDVWAVGAFNPGVPPTVTGRRTLTLHWDGGSWAIVPSPNATWEGVDLSTLEDVEALATDDVWAVGHADDFATLKSTTLILRWNGVRWTIVPSPNPAGGDYPNRLFGIAAISPQDIWAVGEYGYPPKSLIIHWNGTTWAVVANPGTRPLVAVAAVSTNDVWAVTNSAEILHWDGDSWAVVPSPQPSGEFFVMESVAAASARDVWVVGSAITRGSFSSQEHASAPSVPPTYTPLIEHWNGTRWTRLPTTLRTGYRLYDVAALSPPASGPWDPTATAGSSLLAGTERAGEL